MRKLLGLFFLLGLVAFLIFGKTVTDVDYPVKNSYGDLPTQLVDKAVVYRVPGVVRIAGADIYRPEGYFTHGLLKLPKTTVGQVAGVLVKSVASTIPAKLDAKKAKLMGLEPSFSFWEESGKWVLLGGLVFLLLFFFWR